MLESIRSASTAPVRHPELTSARVAEIAVAAGTQRPDAKAPEQAVQSLGKSDASPPEAEHGEHRRPPPTGRDLRAGEQTDDTASADDESTESDAQQTTQEALKDPNSDVSKQVRELSARDREVRAHEQAHLAAAGPYSTYGPNYNFQTGPDGRRYAIGGEVGIDTSVVADDPEATLSKMQTVQRAALAPAEPSAQDMRVAADAAQKAAQARMEIMRAHFEAKLPGSEPSESDTAVSEDTSAPSNEDSTAGSHQAQQAIDAYSSGSAVDAGELLDLAA